MAWVGVNRAIELGEKLGISDEIKSDWSKLEKEIEEWIWDNCYDKKRELFLQYPESKAVDATNFLFVLIKFLDKHDPRTRVILDNTLEILSKDSDLFVHRYNAEDGLEGSEGAFILCTFWMISAYAILEDVELAQKYFKQFESITKPLLSEEIDSKSYEYLGNFPQAFSHLGYAMAANYINKYSNNEK